MALTFSTEKGREQQKKKKVHIWIDRGKKKTRFNCQKKKIKRKKDHNSNVFIYRRSKEEIL